MKIIFTILSNQIIALLSQHARFLSNSEQYAIFQSLRLWILFQGLLSENSKLQFPHFGFILSVNSSKYSRYFKVSNLKFLKTFSNPLVQFHFSVFLLSFEKRLSPSDRSIISSTRNSGEERRIELFGWPASVDFTPIIALSSINRRAPAVRDIVSPSTRIPAHNAPCCESVVADFVAKSRKGLLATPILLPTLTPSKPRRGGERETTAYLVASLHFTRSRSRYFSSFAQFDPSFTVYLIPLNLSSLESATPAHSRSFSSSFEETLLDFQSFSSFRVSEINV